MSSELVVKISATASAYLIAGTYEKYIPENERHKFFNEIRERILHAARHAAIEVRDKLREELREELWEQILENEFGRRPSLN